MMLEGKGLIEDTDMPLKMQIQAMASAPRALDLHYVLDCKSIVAHIKKEFEKRYGNGWQCVVGSNLGCYFTHTTGTFIYFTLETLNFLIFKGGCLRSPPIWLKKENEQRQTHKKNNCILLLVTWVILGPYMSPWGLLEAFW